MLGVTVLTRGAPVFISMSEGSWFGTLACIELITQSSSADSATVGNSSLIHIPDLPCRENWKGDFIAAPVLRSVAR